MQDEKMHDKTARLSIQTASKLRRSVSRNRNGILETCNLFGPVSCWSGVGADDVTVSRTSAPSLCHYIQG